MEIKEEENKKNMSNITNSKKIIEILNFSEKSKNNKIPNIKYILENKNKSGNIKNNIFQNIQNNESNNSIFIFNKNEDIDKIYCNENNSCLSLIKIMEGYRTENKNIKNKIKSHSCDIKNKTKNENLFQDKINISKKCRKSISKINISKINKRIDINNLENNSNYIYEQIPFEDNTKIIATTHIRKLSISSTDSMLDNNFKIINDDKKGNIYSGTKIDFAKYFKINNNIQKTINEIQLLSENYIYKKDDIKKEIKDYSIKDKNLIDKIINNNQYHHQNFFNRVCLDSIEEVYEEENESKTKSKPNSNNTNSELNPIFLEKNINSANNSCKNKNYSKVITPNSICSNTKYNVINNNTTCLSSKYNIGKKNIFDISSDEDECQYQYEFDRKGKIIQNIDNNNLEYENNNCNNIFLKPSDSFMNSNEEENLNSFINDSDFNKLFTSPNKKITSYIDNNSYIPYYQKINNSAMNNKFNKKILLNDENDIDSYYNIFNQYKKGINKKQNYNKTYIKKSIKRDFIFKYKNLKSLISPENLNKYNSNSFINKCIISDNNFDKNVNNKNIKSFKLGIKNYLSDIFICNRISEEKIFKFNESIKSINSIKNKKYIKNFNIKTPYVKKIKVDLNLINIENIEIKRKLINNNASNILNIDFHNVNLSQNNNNKTKNDDLNDNTLSTTIDKKNYNFINNSDNSKQILSFSSKKLITNDSKEILNLNENNKSYINKNEEKISQISQFTLSEKENYNDNLNMNNKKIMIKNLKKTKNGIIKYNNLIFNNSNNLFNNIKEENYIKIKNKPFIVINNNNKNNKMDGYKNNNNSKNHKLFISKESYEEFIQELILKTYEIKVNLMLADNITNLKNNLILNDKILKNKCQKELNEILISFEKKVKLLKNYYLCLLVQKHFLKTKAEKEKLIKEINIKNKREIFYKAYLNVIENIRDKFKFDLNENNKIYLDKIINILKKYKTIYKFDIKYAKRIFKEENDLSPYNLDIKNNNVFSELLKGIFKNDLNYKKILVSTSIILYLLYGINYLYLLLTKNDYNKYN